MADKFYASTAIRLGRRTEDNSQDGKYERITFAEGDEVKGLTKEEMTDLWKAGALRREEATATDAPGEPDENTLNSGAAGKALGDKEASTADKTEPEKTATGTKSSTASAKTATGRTSSGS